MFSFLKRCWHSIKAAVRYVLRKVVGERPGQVLAAAGCGAVMQIVVGNIGVAGFFGAFVVPTFVVGWLVARLFDLDLGRLIGRLWPRPRLA